MNYEIYNGDCLEVMRSMPDASVDAIIADPPYGTTALRWDSIVNIDQMWMHLKRLIKPKGAICLFGNQPFTSQLIISNMRQFKYCWIWQKSKGVGFLNAKNAPIAYHEEIAVFSNGTTANRSPSQMAYFPQGLRPVERERVNYNKGAVGIRPSRIENYVQTQAGYPTTILNYPNDGEGLHPTQKPVALMQYLVRTYTQKGELVLDFTMGAASTGVACAIDQRDFIGIEIDPYYCELGEARIQRALGQGVDIPQRVIAEPAMPLLSEL